MAKNKTKKPPSDWEMARIRVTALFLVFGLYYLLTIVFVISPINLLLKVILGYNFIVSFTLAIVITYWIIYFSQLFIWPLDQLYHLARAFEWFTAFVLPIVIGVGYFSTLESYPREFVTAILLPPAIRYGQVIYIRVTHSLLPRWVHLLGLLLTIWPIAFLLWAAW